MLIFKIISFHNVRTFSFCQHPALCRSTGLLAHPSSAIDVWSHRETREAVLYNSDTHISPNLTSFHSLLIHLVSYSAGRSINNTIENLFYQIKDLKRAWIEADDDGAGGGLACLNSKW